VPLHQLTVTPADVSGARLRLALNAPARRLDCPCHNTSFALGGQLLRHQLAIAPPPLPKFHVREENGAVQIFAPPEA